MMNRNQKNLAPVQSNESIEYTMNPYNRVWRKIYGSSMVTCKQEAPCQGETFERNSVSNILVFYETYIVGICQLVQFPSFSRCLEFGKAVYGTIEINYLTKSIWQSWIHSSSSLSVKYCSFNGYNWLYWCGILYTQEHDGNVHGSSWIEQILLFAPENFNIRSIYAKLQLDI